MRRRRSRSRRRKTGGQEEEGEEGEKEQQQQQNEKKKKREHAAFPECGTMLNSCKITATALPGSSGGSQIACVFFGILDFSRIPS
jgi:hypothetical protein